MSAREASYFVESEGGVTFDGMSEDLLFDMISDLHFPNDSFITVQSRDPDNDWYVVIALMEEGGLEVEYRHPGGREHRVVQEGEPSRVAADVTIWVSSRVRRN
ncbi:hypothetical protein AB0H82_10550 [Streptomyces sp. NPDC050732]|uniref:hypothetical protein n=1 Tax=Streptomyces sp. NPDC050732 TaxID=3154632 RepID=UPI00341E8D8E